MRHNHRRYDQWRWRSHTIVRFVEINARSKSVVFVPSKWKDSFSYCEIVNKLMAKFKVLKYNQMFMSRLGIYSYHLNESTVEFHKSPLAYFILFHLILLVTSCSVSMCSSVDFRKKLEAILLIVAASQAIGSYLNLALNMKDVKALHIELQEVVGKGMIYVQIWIWEKHLHV